MSRDLKEPLRRAARILQSSGHHRAELACYEAADRIAALEAGASEGERRGWLSAVDALDEMAKAMDEKAESLRGPHPFDLATTEEADAAVTGWVLEQAAKLLRERALIPAPAREGWRPIETAPRDGVCIIIAVPANDPSGFVVGEAYCNERRGGWWWANLSYDDDYADPIKQAPTHWRPLPSPPQDREEQ